MFSCGDQRDCRCDTDITFFWENGIVLDQTYPELPNAVLNIDRPLEFVLLTNEEIIWQNCSAKLYNEDMVFIDEKDLSKFITNSATIQFPNELFFNQNGNLITGPVSIEIQINFPLKGATLFVEGSVYYYSCEDISDEFDRVDCRWTNHIGHLEGDDFDSPLIPC